MSSYRRTGKSRGRSSWRGRRKGANVSCANCGMSSPTEIYKPWPGSGSSGEDGDLSVLCQSCYNSQTVGDGPKKPSTTGQSNALLRKRSATPASSVSEDGERERRQDTPPVKTEKVEKISPVSSEGSGRPSSSLNGDGSRRSSTRQASLRHQALTAAHSGNSTTLHLFPGKPGFSLLKNKGGPSGRRTQVFKTASRPPLKGPTRRATVRTSDFIWHDSVKYQVGDIVSVEDADDGLLYYAQIRGLLTDEYAEKWATLSWLLPTVHSPPDGRFDPLSFVYGPNDEKLYPARSLTFHCHPTTPNLKWQWNPREAAQSVNLTKFEEEFQRRSVPAQ